MKRSLLMTLVAFTTMSLFAARMTADQWMKDLGKKPRFSGEFEVGIQAFFDKEVKPFAPDAWIDETKTEIGYERSFTKYFYTPVQLRSPEEIAAELRSLESETAGLLSEILREWR